MNNSVPYLSVEQLNDVLNLSKTATAIHIGETAVIQFANDAMLTIWGKGKEVIGKSLEDALPELKGQPFVEMFARVWREGLTLEGSDTAADLIIDGVLKTFYFDFEYRAVKNESGTVIAIIHSAVDVTERFLNRKELDLAKENKELLQREQSLNEELLATNEEMLAVNEELSQSREELTTINSELEVRVDERIKAFVESEQRFHTMAEGTEVLISVSNPLGNSVYFNNAWSALTGRSAKQLEQKGWFDLLHSDDRPTYIAMCQQALAKRQAYSGEFRLLGKSGEYHWLLEKGNPRFFNDGQFAGYISSCVDITRRKQDEQQIQDANEALMASNEEFHALNEELSITNQELEAAHADLSLSELKFKNLVLQAPFGICIIRADDLLVTDVNDSYLELVGRQRQELENKSIWDAIPEAAAKYKQILRDVIDHGNPFFANEHELELVRNGMPEKVFVDFIYEPIYSLDNEVEAVMVVGNEVSEKVIARHRIEEVEERNRLAIEAAEIGTFEFDYRSGKLKSSDRFNEIFGVNDIVSRDQVIAKYLPEDVSLSEQAHEAAKVTGKLFYEARLLLAERDISWVSVRGNVHYDEHGERKRLLGTVLDITEYKRLQQQKDDFISIASHELKTPLTSLKGSMQLLNRMKLSPTAVLPRLIDQCTKSTQRITDLVEDLLNVSRMNAGQVNLAKQPFVINDVIQDSLAHIGEHERERFVTAGNLQLVVNADEHRVVQVLINLINNAIKYAPASLEILITVEVVDQMAKISVKDAGPGVEPEKLQHLFDRYYRAGNDELQISGLGLGLYISSDIVNRHGGKIGVESVLGEGSTFWFTLPIR